MQTKDMKHKLPLLLAVILAVVTACGPTRYSTSFNLKAIDEYAFVEPYSHVIYYNERNKPMYDAGLSHDAALVLHSSKC